MKNNFKMWGHALWNLVKMDSKEEWEDLDLISKWLIATRSAVVTLGLFIAHGTNNLLNDYTDYSRGVDEDNYFRTAYGVHPLVQKFWTKGQQLIWFVLSGLLAVAAGIYALLFTNFSPIILGLFAFGALILIFYTWPLKYLGLGELLIFLIWGPIMIGGVYLVLSKGWADTAWLVALAGSSFGLSVVSINIGKHIDKSEEDPAMLIILLAVKRLILAIRVHTQPKPQEPPEEFEYWPTWFAAFAFYHNRALGGLLILGLIIDALLRVFLPGFWPMS